MNHHASDTARTCAICHSPCVPACPAHQFYRTQTYTPARLGLLAYRLRERLSQPDLETAQVLFEGCSGCGLCTGVHCMFEGLNLPAAIESARKSLVDGGFVPPGAARLRDALASTGNPFGLDLRPALERIRRLSARRAPFGVYCGPAVLALRPEIAEAALAVFSCSGLATTVLETPDAAGGLAHSLGFTELAARMASRVANAVRESGVRTLVSLDPSETVALRSLYRSLGLLGDVEVLDLTETLARLLAEGRLPPARPLPGVAVYHDPSALARMLGVTVEPRRVLGAIPGLTLKETRRFGREARSLGGYLEYLRPEVSDALARLYWDDVQALGADLLVVADPLEKDKLLRHAPTKSPRLVHLAELLNDVTSPGG